MKRFIPKRIKELFLKLLKSHNTTEEVADGLAIGVFIAFLPILGIQMYVAFALTELFRKNVLAALIAVWLTNPFTAVPIYLFNIWVGNLFFNNTVSFSELATVIRTLDLHNILTAGKHILVPLWVGSAIVGLAMAFVSQRLCLYFYDDIKEKFLHLTHHQENQ